MQESVIKDRQRPFETIRRYLETIVGCKANFTIKKNRSCPFGIFFTDPEIDYYRAREFSHQNGGCYGWYPPLMVMFRLDDSRPCRILKSHYQGISSFKAKLQVAFFSFLEKGWMKGFLLPAYVLVQPDDGKIEEIADSLGGMVFGGQGSKVKIFKFDEGIVLNFLKQEYDKESLLKEISVRETFQDLLPIPKLLKANKELGFFVEEYIPSVPLRNLNKQIWPLFTDLFEKLFIYYKKDSVNSVPYYDYQEMIMDEIKGKAAFLDDVTRKKVLEMISILCESCRQDQNDETLLVQSHGDFWLGNILYDEKSKKLFIVDWERTDRYSLMHDLFKLFAVYSIEQRSLKFISYILDWKTNNNQVGEILQKYQNQFSVSLNRSFLEKYLAIFLLEKIRFPLRNIEGEIFVFRDEETEIQKWYRFFKDILNKGLLTGFVQ